MKCSNCGFELPDNAKFCSACGSKIEYVDISPKIVPDVPKQEEMTEYWIHNIKSDDGAEFSIGGVTLAYDANIVSYNNFTKPFRRYEVEQRGLAIDFVKESINELEDFLSYGVDYAKKVEEDGYKNALSELEKIGISLDYDKLHTYKRDKDFDCKKSMEEIYSRLKERGLKPIAATGRFAGLISRCVHQAFNAACDVIYEKGWVTEWLDDDEMKRLGQLIRENRDNKKTLKDIGIELLKVTPYLELGYGAVFEADSSLTDELMDFADYWGKAELIRQVLLAGMKSRPNQFWISDREDSIFSLSRMWELAEEGHAVLEYKLERYYDDKYLTKIKNSTLKEDNLIELDVYLKKNYRMAKYLKAYLLWRRYLYEGNKDKAKEYSKIISEIAEEKLPRAMEWVGHEGTQDDYYGIPHDRALLFLKEAADMQDPSAMYLLGKYYRDGSHGVPKDEKKSAELLNKAATFGHKGAQDLLNGGCYITTAVCEFQGKADDCYELTMFRRFRDKWLIDQQGGKELVKEYYSTAPRIVTCIDQRDDRGKIYTDIWNRWLKPCLTDIEKGNFKNCKETYIKMVRDLEKSYL